MIMKFGGWATRSVFERYSIIDQGDMVDAMRKFERQREAETLKRAAEQAGPEQDQKQPSLSRPI
jgi:hypothetical protein